MKFRILEQKGVYYVQYKIWFFWQYVGKKRLDSGGSAGPFYPEKFHSIKDARKFINSYAEDPVRVVEEVEV